MRFNDRWKFGLRVRMCHGPFNTSLEASGNKLCKNKTRPLAPDQTRTHARFEDRMANC